MFPGFGELNHPCHYVYSLKMQPRNPFKVKNMTTFLAIMAVPYIHIIKKRRQFVSKKHKK